MRNVQKRMSFGERNDETPNAELLAEILAELRQMNERLQSIDTEVTELRDEVSFAIRQRQATEWRAA